MKTKTRARPKDAELTGPLLTLGQVCEVLGRARATVRNLIRKKRLTAVLVGPDIMVTKRSVDDYLRPRPYAPRRGRPVCAGWNDKLRQELARPQESGASS